MLDYTRLALQKTFEDFKRIGHILGIITQLLYIAYLIYSIIAQAGRWWIKAIFLTISVAYFVFYLIVYYTKKKRLQKIGKKIVKRSKLVIKLFDLGIAFYSISVTIENVKPESVILLASMISFWLLQVVFDIITTVIENRINLILEGWKADLEEIRRPVDNVSNFVKKITGQPVEPKQEKTKQRVWLDEKISASRQEQREFKRIRKETEKAKKQAKREEKKAIREEQRLQRKNKKNGVIVEEIPQETKKKRKKEKL